MTTTSRVPIATVDALPLVRTNFGRELLGAAAFAAPFVVFFLVFGSWALSVRVGLGFGPIVLLDGLATASFAVIVVLLALGSAIIGVHIRDDGIAVYERLMRGHRAYETFVPWVELGPPEMAGPVGSDVIFETADDPIRLNREPARAVLKDPRWPFSGKVPPLVARRLGLDTRPR